MRRSTSAFAQRSDRRIPGRAGPQRHARCAPRAAMMSSLESGRSGFSSLGILIRPIRRRQRPYAACRSCSWRASDSIVGWFASPCGSAGETNTPIQGISKFFNTQLRGQIIVNTGAPLAKRLTSHVLRRTVATRLAEVLGDDGDRLIKRVGGTRTAASPRSTTDTAMCARCRALVKWANELTSEADVHVFGDVRQVA